MTPPPQTFRFILLFLSHVSKSVLNAKLTEIYIFKYSKLIEI